MNEPQIDLPNPPRSYNDPDTVESLRQQVNFLLGTLIVTSITLTLYLGVQARWATMDDNAARARLDEATRMFQQDNASFQTAFKKLTEFGRTHPDFQNQILSKYMLNEPAAPAPKK